MGGGGGGERVERRKGLEGECLQLFSSVYQL